MLGVSLDREISHLGQVIVGVDQSHSDLNWEMAKTYREVESDEELGGKQEGEGTAMQEFKPSASGMSGEREGKTEGPRDKENIGQWDGIFVLRAVEPVHL